MFYVPQLILSRFAVRKISVYADVSIHRQYFGHLLSHRARRRPRNQVVVVLEVPGVAAFRYQWVANC